MEHILDHLCTFYAVIETKSRSVKGQPKTVLLKPVPGQFEKLFPAATHPESRVNIAGQGGSSSDSVFLQEDGDEPEEEENEEGEEEEEEGQELSENDIYKRWQNALTDQRLQNLLEESELQRVWEPTVIFFKFNFIIRVRLYSKPAKVHTSGSLVKFRVKYSELILNTT